MGDTKDAASDAAEAVDGDSGGHLLVLLLLVVRAVPGTSMSPSGMSTLRAIGARVMSAEPHIEA